AEKCLTLHLVWDLHASRGKQRRSNISEDRTSFDLRSASAIQRQLDHQGYVDGFVIQKNAMRVLAVRAQRFAVISHNGDHSFVVQAMFLQFAKEPPNFRVGIGDFAVVRLRTVFLFETCWRVIWIMSIVKMDPQEERPALHVAEPS